MRRRRERARGPRELSAAEAYALWAPTYAPCAHNGLMALEEAAVLDLLPDPAGRRCLDVGCGSGRYLKLLRARGAVGAVGCDLSAEMLERARPLGPRLLRADLLTLPFTPGSFDLVVSGLVVGHVADLGRVMSETARVLTAAGAVVYSDVHPAGSLAGWKRTFRTEAGESYAVRQHVHLYADHQAACRAAGLAIEEVREPRIDFDDEWRGFPAALVIRARKP